MPRILLIIIFYYCSLHFLCLYLGDTFRINDVVMGIGVLAVGSSIPEVVSAIINAQNGKDKTKYYHWYLLPLQVRRGIRT